MTAIDIDPKYRLGHDAIDREHAQLIGIARELQTALKEGTADGLQIKRIVDRLVAYTRTHFENEEALMAAAGYPGLSEHRTLHAELNAKVRQFATELLDNQDKTALKINLFMNVWLFEHISRDDAAFVKFAAGRQGTRT